MRSVQEQREWENETQKQIEVLGWEYLGAEVVVKEDSKFMKFLNVFVGIFNKHFMDRYITTINTKVYAPEGKCNWRTLAHEFTHMSDECDRYGWKYKLMYLFPQFLVLGMLGAIGAFWSLHFLWFLACGLFLLPIPAPGRTHIELRGYTMSLAVAYWQSEVSEDRHYRKFDKTEEDRMIQWCVEQFTSSSYYFMCPFKGYVETSLREGLQEAKDGILYSSIPIARQIQEIVQRELRS